MKYKIIVEMVKWSELTFDIISLTTYCCEKKCNDETTNFIISKN